MYRAARPAILASGRGHRDRTRKVLARARPSAAARRPVSSAMKNTAGGRLMSDLIVIGYPDEETATNVWQEVIKL